MTKDQEKLNEALKARFGAPVQCEIATVESVDEDKASCVVTLADGTEIEDVRLKASIDEDMHDGLVQIPGVGSSVVVGLIGNDLSTRFVMLFTVVTKVVFFGGARPIVDWPAIKAELDKTNEVVQALADSLTGWTPVANDGGAALKAYATSQLSGKAVGNYEDKQDDKILH